jgi:hypothetical protein
MAKCSTNVAMMSIHIDPGEPCAAEDVRVSAPGQMCRGSSTSTAARSLRVVPAATASTTTSVAQGVLHSL